MFSAIVLRLSHLVMSGFFEELQRRKVYRVAAAYMIAAGFIIQIGSAVFSRLGITELGVPPGRGALIDWLSDHIDSRVGLRRHSARNSRNSGACRAWVASSAQFDNADCGRSDHSAGAGFFLLPRVSGRKVDKSIAVLPFENLSDEKENAYFADGIQDDILTNLSKIG